MRLHSSRWYCLVANIGEITRVIARTHTQSFTNTPQSAHANQSQKQYYYIYIYIYNYMCHDKCRRRRRVWVCPSCDKTTPKRVNLLLCLCLGGTVGVFCVLPWPGLLLSIPAVRSWCGGRSVLQQWYSVCSMVSVLPPACCRWCWSFSVHQTDC